MRVLDTWKFTALETDARTCTYVDRSTYINNIEKHATAQAYRLQMSVRQCNGQVCINL